MTIISEPNTTVNIVNAALTVQNTGQKLLFVGQQTSGSATSGDLIQNIPDDGSENTLFGEDSMLAAMIRTARKLNKIVQFDAIPLDDNGAAVSATGEFDIVGTATEDGSITFTVGSLLNNSYTVGVTSGDSALDIATALDVLINADGTSSVTPLIATSTVGLTAINAGTYGNTLSLAMNGEVAGITITIQGMSGGSTDPVLTGVFDVVGDSRYQGTVWPYDDVTVLTSFLDSRFNVNNDVLDGAGFVSITDTLANHLSRLALLNSENLVELCDKLEVNTTLSGSAIIEIPVVKASQFSAIRSLRLSPGASIAQFVISANGALDAFGGPALASKPYANTPFPNLPIIPVGLGFTSSEITQIQNAGGTVLGNNTARTSVIVGRVSTTYKTDAAGNPDLTFKFLNYRDTASGIREYVFNNLKARFAQTRLTEGDPVPGRDQVNADTIRAFVERLYQDLSGPNFVLTQGGDGPITFFKNNLVVTLDLSTGTVTIQSLVPIVTQLRDIIYPMQITFSTEG